MFTQEPTITDSTLIGIWFKTSSNNIYPFATVYTRLWKRNNDCFQFSPLHLYMIMTGTKVAQNAARMSKISKIFLKTPFMWASFQSETIMPPKKKLKATNNESGDDQVQLLLETLINIKSKKSYEGIDWESIKEKYEIIRKEFLAAFPSKSNKEFHMINLFFLEKEYPPK